MRELPTITPEILEDLGAFVPRLEEPAWRREATCRKADDLETFFPRTRPPAALKALCADCPVRQECKEFALDSPWEPYGVWGGLGPSELRPEWVQRHEEAATHG